MGLLDFFGPRSSSYALMTPAQASPLIHQMASSIAGMGAIGNPARLGVQTTLEGLSGRMTPIDLAVNRAYNTANNLAANPWVKWGGAGLAGYNGLFPLSSPAPTAQNAGTSGTMPGLLASFALRGSQ